MPNPESVNNAKTLPARYYGLHICPGVAEYEDEPGKGPYRILINEGTIKQMDPTFSCKPVYVQHVDRVDLDNLQEEMDGVVVQSFYNQLDGKHWVEFIVTSDEAHERIAQGWKLSNAYVPKEMGAGGTWHNVDYSKEVLSGEYEHLAIVPNPRYEESEILTPDEFKAYNARKEAELKTLSNSKKRPAKGDRAMPVMNLFRKTKVENPSEVEAVTVKLSNGKEMTIRELVKNAEDGPAASADQPVVVDLHSKIKVGDEEMTIEDLIGKYLAERKRADGAESDAAGSSGDSELENEEADRDPADKARKSVKSRDNESSDDESDVEKKKKTSESDSERKKENAEQKARRERIEAQKQENHFESLRNAPEQAPAIRLELQADKIARGKERYGS